MVQAPKCKVCGQPHFGAEHVWPDANRYRQTLAHVAQGVPDRDRRNTLQGIQQPSVQAVNRDQKDKVIAELRAHIAKLERDAAQTAKRRERQRELMKARRAKP